MVEPQNQRAVTKFDEIVMTTAMQPFCSCGRGEKVIYYCNRPECPNHKKQPMYCTQCLEDDPSSHEHKPKMILYQNNSIKGDWLAIRQEVGSKTALVKQWLEGYQGLLELLSAEEPRLQNDINTLLALEMSISDYY